MAAAPRVGWALPEVLWQSGAVVRRLQRLAASKDAAAAKGAWRVMDNISESRALPFAAFDARTTVSLVVSMARMRAIHERGMHNLVKRNMGAFTPSQMAALLHAHTRLAIALPAAVQGSPAVMHATAKFPHTTLHYLAAAYRSVYDGGLVQGRGHDGKRFAVPMDILGTALLCADPGFVRLAPRAWRRGAPRHILPPQLQHISYAVAVASCREMARYATQARFRKNRVLLVRRAVIEYARNPAHPARLAVPLIQAIGELRDPRLRLSLVHMLVQMRHAACREGAPRLQLAEISTALVAAAKAELLAPGGSFVGNTGGLPAGWCAEADDSALSDAAAALLCLVPLATQERGQSSVRDDAAACACMWAAACLAAHHAPLRGPTLALCLAMLEHMRVRDMRGMLLAQACWALLQQWPVAVASGSEASLRECFDSFLRRALPSALEIHRKRLLKPQQAALFVGAADLLDMRESLMERLRIAAGREAPACPPCHFVHSL